MILVIMLLFVLLFMPSKPNTNHFKKNEVNNSNNNKNKKIEKGVYKLLLKYTRLELNKFIIAFVVMILAVGMNGAVLVAGDEIIRARLLPRQFKADFVIRSDFLN